MSNTRETISLKYDAEYYKGKRKGKDTCDDAFPLVSLSSVLKDERKKKTKKKKKRKKAGDPRQRLRSWIFFFLFFPL